jgi:hypothetical protein
LFIDEINTAPDEFHNALTALMDLDDRVLIVPNLLHFAGSGNPIEFRQSLQNNQIEVLLSEAPKQPQAENSSTRSPNIVLREARQRTPSPMDPTRSMSRSDLAEAVCAWLWRDKGIQVALDAHYIAKLERGAVRRTGRLYRDALRAVLNVSTGRELGMSG